jgi:hypothetical protein
MQSESTTASLAVLNKAERLTVAYFTAVPLLWVSGLLLPVALLVVFRLFWLCCSRRALALAWPWFVVAACQLASVVSNLLADGQPMWMVVRHILASYVMGWLTLGAAVTVGASGMIRVEVLWRCAARIGTYAVVMAAIMYPIALVYPERYLHVLTPIGQMLPVSLPSTSFFFGMLIFNWEELFGVALPRLSLFFPWTTALGFGGVGLIFVALSDDHPSRRRRTVGSGLFMVLSSMSRLSFAALLAAVAAWWLLGRARRTQLVVGTFAVASMAAVIIASTLWFGSPTGLVSALGDSFEDVRPSASRSRELVYEESWAGFRQAPLLGHGWPGESVYPEDWPQIMQGGGTMVPGSHSTFLGLLYLGGALTLGAFLFALLRTTLLVAASATTPSIKYSTVALLVGIAVTAVGESLFSVVVPSLFAFLWLGVALRSCGDPAAVRIASPAARATIAWDGAAA